MASSLYWSGVAVGYLDKSRTRRPALRAAQKSLSCAETLQLSDAAWVRIHKPKA